MRSARRSGGCRAAVDRVAQAALARGLEETLVGAPTVVVQGAVVVLSRDRGGLSKAATGQNVADRHLGADDAHRHSRCPLIQTTVTETAGFVQGAVKNSRIHKAFDAVNSYKGLDNTATILVSCVPTVRDTFLYTVLSAPGIITTVFEHGVSRRGPTVRKKRRSTSLVRLLAECDNYLLSLFIKESR